MAYRAYVGNIPFTFAKADLEQLFQPFGVVKHTDVILDRETGRSRGFGFVEMETAEQLAAAIQGLNGSLVNGRPLTVNEARERERTGGPPRGPGGFAPRPGGDRGFGGDRGYGGDRGQGGFSPRPAGDRGPSGDRGPGGPPRSPGATPPPRTGADRAPAAPGGPPKRERGPDRSSDRRHTKMDSYERDHKDWRKYSDDDDGWQ